MDKSKELYYYSLLEDMTDMMNDPDNFDRDAFIRILTRFAELFNVSKGVTEFYMSLTDEKNGYGEVLIDYDNGHGDKEIVKRRIVAKSGVVMKCTFYAAADSPELPTEDLKKLDLIARMILGLVSRNRLIGVVEKLGFTDGQGYPNYRTFLRYLQNVNSEGTLGGRVAFKYNLRHFGLVNQDVGRTVGDVVMRNHFELISSIVGNHGIVCRMGGDNFIGILDKKDLESLLAALSGVPVVYDNGNLKRVMVRSSVGVFELPDPYRFEDPDDIMDILMPAASIAKNGSGDSIVFADEKLLKMKHNSMMVQKNFPKALAENEFFPYYQPQVDITTGRTVGAEALCRWKKDGRLIMPGQFIPVLEQSTDICLLDFYMLDAVCRDIRRWMDEGSPIVRISVNMSRKHLIDVDFVEHLTSIIDRRQIPRDYIEIEFTETVDNAGFGELKQVVEKLRSVGIYTSVDDFGAGYTALALLSDIPWNIIKIDRSFLPEQGKNDTANLLPIMKHIAQIADELGMSTVVEGVETEEHVKIMRENNCRIAQGFFYHRPMPVTDFEELLLEETS
ncbi:MAG: GGDEF domain-containing phosphodiesterase [Saccharofermentans sp.]|nr:GGDEF domain-containing phosphodiesterase [Saccharofermentans sp.]